MMVPFFIFILLGGYWLMAFIFVISLMGVYEFYKGFHSMDRFDSVLFAAPMVYFYITFVIL